MTWTRRIMWLGVAIAVLSVPACVELCGQRISIFYDQAKDQLQLLIFYDGIYDTGSTSNGEGKKQIPEFVANGDVMIADWPFHFEMNDIREKAAAMDEKTPAPYRDMIQAVADTLKTEPVGHYRDGDARLGAAQLITIQKASEFVRKVNAAFSYMFLDEMDDLPEKLEDVDDEYMGRTGLRWLDAAKAGHQWFGLDGHALTFRFPVHQREWAAGKAEALKELMDQLVDLERPEAMTEPADKPSDDEEGYATAVNFLRLLTSATLSYTEADGWVTVRVGDSKLPTQLNMRIRESYEPNLEEVVTTHVPANLDDAIGMRLIGRAEDTPHVRAVLDWGPPEAAVGALLKLAESDDAEARQEAVKKLQWWAFEWKRHDGPVPDPPADDHDTFIEAWKEFHRQMYYFPLEQEPPTEEPEIEVEHETP